MYHGYDYDDCDMSDTLTLYAVTGMDARALYDGLVSNKMQMCGGFPAVSALLLSKSLGHEKAVLLRHTNSCEATGDKRKGIWTVGYGCVAIDNPDPQHKEAGMLNKEQRKKLLGIARSTIEKYLKDGARLQVKETDPALTQVMGAFVTLQEHGQLRGCIGNMVGTQPLYLTVRDMAIESSQHDPRFSQVEPGELKDIEIEISALSPMKRVASADEIVLGTHGVLVRRGYSSGVYLPQVATETGWTKEQFLSHLCAEKAGIAPDAWKDKSTELYTFTAEVFSEKEF
jgi:AmmeMemoRadiSam system protein A